jgi:hypothetical protein
MYKSLVFYFFSTTDIFVFDVIFLSKSVLKIRLSLLMAGVSDYTSLIILKRCFWLLSLIISILSVRFNSF